MKEYNTAFFNLYETWFKVLKSAMDEEKALMLFKKVMETMLESAYGSDFDKGYPHEFIRMVSVRDNNVGVKVSFSEINDCQFVYIFHTDVFPNLKGHVDPIMLIDTYISFKVSYLLGDDWSYKTLNHIWNGDECTEILIFKDQD